MPFYFSPWLATKNAIVPNFSLVNQPSLDKILKVEVFVHIDGQLRAAHLILEYIPISKRFLAPKCVIKARDPRLHRINVVVPSFLVPDPIPTSIQQVELPFQRVAEEEATPSQPTIKEKEQVVEVSDFEDEFEVFN